MDSKIKRACVSYYSLNVYFEVFKAQKNRHIELQFM